MATDAVGKTSTVHRCPLWMHPIWWVVIGGPLVVVVAAIVTAVIAVRGQDPLLSRSVEPTGPSGLSVPTVQHHAPSPALSVQRAFLPAIEGRNHAVTPSLPPASSGAQ